MISPCHVRCAGYKIQPRLRGLRSGGEPIQLFYLESLFHRRWINFAPCGMVPGDRLQSIVGRLEDHGRFSRLALLRVESDSDLTARINPMTKQGYGTVTWIFCNRCAAIRTQT